MKKMPNFNTFFGLLNRNANFQISEGQNKDKIYKKKED
jgi:hypothetical protein